MTSKLSRRQVLKGGAGTFALTAALGINPKFIRPAHAAGGYAPGMTGGAVGFPGAERFQYNESHSEGRAIEGIKKLQADGNAPQKLTVLWAAGAIGQLTRPFPAGAKSIKETWEEETGIELEIIGAPAADIWTKILQDVTTKSGGFDIYTQPWNNVGDLVEAGGAVDLTEFVDKYQPDWNDKERGVVSEQVEELLYKYDGRNWAVAIDGDFHSWVYNRAMYEDPMHQDAFEAKYGMKLEPATTWQQSDAISEYFTGVTGLNGVTMYGNGNMMSPFWGLPTFYSRFASQAIPNHYWFDDDGNPNLDTDLGIKAATEYVASKQWAHPDILSWTYAEAYAGMADGISAHICTYTNLAKFNDRILEDGSPASAITGKLGAHIPPGNIIGDKNVRRSTIYYNTMAEVSSQSPHQEAAYLFLQWVSSTRIYSWLCANPGGFLDPLHKANFAEPYVHETYHEYLTDVILETSKRSVPTLNFPGQTAMDNALDEELQAALTGQKSPEDAMQAAAKRWKRIIRRKGETRMIDTIKRSRAGWPTLVDDA